MNRLRCVACVLLAGLLAFILLAPRVEAAVLMLDKNVFNVNVSNENFKPLYQARVNGFMSGTSANIRIEADGYQTENLWIATFPSQTNYYVNARLRSPWVHSRVLDSTGHLVQTCEVDLNQFTYWADEFGVKVRVRRANFPNLRPFDVRLYANGLSIFGERTTVYEQGSLYLIESVFRRSSFGYNPMSVWLDVVLPKPGAALLPLDAAPSTVAETIREIDRTALAASNPLFAEPGFASARVATLNRLLADQVVAAAAKGDLAAVESLSLKLGDTARHDLYKAAGAAVLAAMRGRALSEGRGVEALRALTTALGK